MIRPLKSFDIACLDNGYLRVESGSSRGYLSPPPDCRLKNWKSSWGPIVPLKSKWLLDNLGWETVLQDPLYCDGPQLLFPFKIFQSERSLSERGHESWYQYWARLPRKWKDFLSDIQESHYECLRLLQRYPEARDLLDSSPALLFLLATPGLWPEADPRLRYKALPRLLKQTQRAILSYFGFPGSKSVVKMFRRLRNCNSGLIHGLRQHLSSPPAQPFLSHHHYYTDLQLAIIANPQLRAIFSFDVLHALSTAGSNCAKVIVYFFLNNQKSLNEHPSLGTCLPLSSYHQVMHALDTLRGEISMEGCWRNKPFPPPPLQIGESFIPLESASDLVEETIVQNNCVAFLVAGVYSGHCYFYRTSHPRTTVSIRFDGTRWCFGECLAASNQEIPQADLQNIKRQVTEAIKTMEPSHIPPKPIFIDFEASSLSDDSWPIEIAWGAPGGPVESYLISPEVYPRWTDWSAKSEALHGISREQLRKEGVPPTRLCQRLLKVFPPGSIVYSDNPEWDKFWWDRLFSAGWTPAPEVYFCDSQELMENTVLTCEQEVSCIKRARRTFPPKHRAGPDVERLCWLYLHLFPDIGSDSPDMPVS